MTGLLYKDLINLKSTFKIYCLITVIWGVIFIPDGNYSIFGLLMVMMATLVVTTLSYDDLANWDQYALTMPVSRKEVVYSKYLLLLLLDTIGAVTALLVGGIGAGLGFFEPMEIVLVLAVVFMIALIFGATILPLIYRFGTEKARMLILLVAGIPSGFLLIISNFLEPQTIRNLRIIFNKPLLLILGGLIFTLLYLFISLKISVRLYTKKDF